MQFQFLHLRKLALQCSSNFQNHSFSFSENSNMSPISVIVMLTYKLLFCNNGSTKFTATHFRILQSQRLTQPCYQSLLWGHMPAHGGVGLRQL